MLWLQESHPTHIHIHTHTHHRHPHTMHTSHSHATWPHIYTHHTHLPHMHIPDTHHIHVPQKLILHKYHTYHTITTTTTHIHTCIPHTHTTNTPHPKHTPHTFTHAMHIRSPYQTWTLLAVLTFTAEETKTLWKLIRNLSKVTFCSINANSLHRHSLIWLTC